MNFKSFGEDVDYLQQYVETIVLGDKGGPQIAVVPAYQGRTMTSTTSGREGNSFGWINYERVAANDNVPQINLFGGEDRFWLSPEGSQFSVFFDPDVPLNFANWRTPKVLDTEAFEVTHRSDKSLSFRKQATLKNYSGFEFDLQFDRTVNLMDRQDVLKKLLGEFEFGDLKAAELAIVAHESHNTLTNVGTLPWLQATGLLGIWILCMNKPSKDATIVVPFKRQSDSSQQSIVNSDYFGQLDERRLIVDREHDLIYFKGDGEFRSKIGLTFDRAMPMLAAWDRSRKTLTVTQYNLPTETKHGYTNNLWKILDDPFAGDVINSYNDGPNESGGMLGPFYELETLSPALALAPAESYTHIHRTIHVEGNPAEISLLTTKLFGVPLEEIERQFGEA